MKLNDLVQHISHTGASETDITAITYDSRKACAGSLFVCLVGAWLDIWYCTTERNTGPMRVVRGIRTVQRKRCPQMYPRP